MMAITRRETLVTTFNLRNVSSVSIFLMILNVRRSVRASDVSLGICLLLKSLMSIFLNVEIYKLGVKNGTPRSPAYKEKKFREDIPLVKRGIGEKVQVEPEESEVG